MKKYIFILSLLHLLDISAYTEKIIIMGKDNKRFILIGDVHRTKTFVKTEQEPFFKNLFSNLNQQAKKERQSVVVYQEGLYGLQKFLNNIRSWWDNLFGPSTDPSQFTPNTDPNALLTEESLEDKLNNINLASDKKGAIKAFFQHMYSDFTSWSGATLASLRFKNTYKFTLKNYDIREIIENEKDSQSVYQTIIDSILYDNKQYETAYKKLFENNPQGEDRLRILKAAAMDLGLIEELSSNHFTPYSIFVVHAGLAHVNFLTKLLKIEGWNIINNLNTTNPSYWYTEDAIVGPLFNFSK